MSWMQSAPHGRRSRAKASAGQGRCWSAGGSPEEMTGAGLAEKGRAAAWLDRMRRLQLPGKLPARTLQSHLHNSHHLNSRNVWKRCRWMALLLCWVLGWSVFSFWIVSYMRSQIVEMRREVLANMCEERARLLQDQVKTSMNQLQALTIVVSTFHDSKIPSAIDQVTFARYAERTAFERRPLTSGLAYAPKVTHAEREQFEQQQAWSIKMVRSSTKTMNSSYERSPAEEEYAPIIFTQDAYKHVVSVDMLSGNEDRENVLRARESGKVALSAPFKLHNNHTGVILTYAAYSSKLRSNATAQDRVQSAIGYLGGIFDIETHVDSLLHQLAGKQSIMLNLYDTTDDSPISMYGTNETAGTSGLCHTCTLDFGDPSRKYQMHCRFLQRPPWPWLAIVSSCGSLVVSLLIGYIVKGADVIQAKHGLMSVEQQDKLNDTERSTKFITNVKELLSSASIIQSLSSRFSNLNIKLGSISLLGLVLCILLIGAFDRPFHQGSGKRRGDGNIMLKKFGWSRRRLLVSTLHGNTDGKASKYQEETTQIQNGTVRPHLQAHKSNILTTVGPWIALVSVIMVVVGIAIWLLLWCNRRKRVQQNDLELLGGITGPRRFQLHELAAATSNFADEKKLGRGGFGHVYKGYLRDQDLHVAIKVLSKKQSSQEQSEQGLREFKAEVKVMAQLRHRNIVKLVGWCDSKKRLLLVYEIMAQGSLDKHLYDPEKILTWQQRYLS
ncbi:hypothetical protein C2845_PM04G07360 [Panicum miliaceum]|uniref:Protein kinase domain-containing protein n=1 Tax=Panicum miliaceum TaxID=4540 RepID=A0A3L6QKI2_PANMI|nr:hypothetical protein C2845_PM04G07360 [Panicum miliaceum]